MKVFNLPLLIQWNKFQPGTSFFVPCVYRRAVQRYVESECRRFGVEITCKQVIEKGVYGVRVWRNPATITPHSSSPLEKL